VHDPPPGGQQSGRVQKIIGASCDLGGSERGSTAVDQTALSNEQTSRILLAIPFGLAWVAAGIALVRQSNCAAALSL
jgi:hypothetical protein